MSSSSSYCLRLVFRSARRSESAARRFSRARRRSRWAGVSSASASPAASPPASPPAPPPCRGGCDSVTGFPDDASSAPCWPAACCVPSASTLSYCPLLFFFFPASTWASAEEASSTDAGAAVSAAAAAAAAFCVMSPVNKSLATIDARFLGGSSLASIDACEDISFLDLFPRQDFFQNERFLSAGSAPSWFSSGVGSAGVLGADAPFVFLLLLFVGEAGGVTVAASAASSPAGRSLVFFREKRLRMPPFFFLASATRSSNCAKVVSARARGPSAELSWFCVFAGSLCSLRSLGSFSCSLQAQLRCSCPSCRRRDTRALQRPTGRDRVLALCCAG